MKLQDCTKKELLQIIEQLRRQIGDYYVTRALLPDGERSGLAGLLGGYATVYDEVVVSSGIPNLDVIPASEELWGIDLQEHTGDGPLHGTANAHLRAGSPVPVFDTVICRTDKVLEATWAREPVQTWNPFSSAARDYRAWVRELVAKEGLDDGR